MIIIKKIIQTNNHLKLYGGYLEKLVTFSNLCSFCVIGAAVLSYL